MEETGAKASNKQKNKAEPQFTSHQDVGLDDWIHVQAAGRMTSPSSHPQPTFFLNFCLG
jgi:hypothetical protein